MMLVPRQRLSPTGCECVSPPLGCLVNIRVFAAGFAQCLPGRLSCSECTFQAVGDGPPASALGAPPPRSRSCDDFMTLTWPWGRGTGPGLYSQAAIARVKELRQTRPPAAGVCENPLLPPARTPRVPLPTPPRPFNRLSPEVLLSQGPRGGNDPH